MLLAEGGIRFVEGRSNEIACADYSSIGCSNRQHVCRCLAGMLCQAIYAPDSIEEPLRGYLNDVTLFENVTVYEDEQMLTLMAKHGFQTDWALLWSYAGLVETDEEKRLALLRGVHQEIESLFQTIVIKDWVAELHADINKWLWAENEELRFSPLVIYSVGLARPIYESIVSRHGAGAISEDGEANV